ncbi:MAG: tetratricopeptide repeat protein, partial [Candidatus Xenobia bacterium]
MSFPARWVNQLHARAFCLERLGRDAEAMQAYMDALQCDLSVPQAPRSALKLAHLLVADGRRTAARNVLADVLQQWP